jgi:peptidoglycan-N-acetylglucosamine deacetylase
MALGPRPVENFPQMSIANDRVTGPEDARSVKPVFFDPTLKRWPRLRLGAALLALTLFLLLGALALSIIASPIMPALRLPGSGIAPHGAHMIPPVPALSPERVLTRRARALRDAEAKLTKERERSLQQLLAEARKSLPKPDGQALVIGFFVNWDDASTSSLKENLGSLNMLIPEWLHLAGEDGTVREDDPNRQAQIIQYIRARRPDLPIMPLVNNWNGQRWEGAKLARMLADPAARKRAIGQLARYLQDHQFAGVSIDFENIPTKTQPAFRRFLAELFGVLHPKGLLLSVNVPASDPAFNYAELARSADYLILMAYDEHWSTGPPGPIASLPWFGRVLRERQRDVPADKMIVAIGNYAYDWAEGGHAEERTFEEAVLTAKESEGDIRLDPVSLNAHFDYADDDDHLHHVWLLDAVSAFNQLVVARSVHPHGVALWRLGSEDPALWQVFGKNGPLEAEQAARLQDTQFGYALDYEGRGEILQITATPQRGRRTIAFDARRHLITEEHFTVFPSPYVVTRRGSQERKVVLTFDDGPDPEYTPRILDALKQANVSGTFFITGANGNLFPDLLRRELAEGHEIGNHTFTHPDISVISPTQLLLELSATQRLLASAVGRHSLLFRPPYAVDAEPETADQVSAIELTSEQGYLSVGMQIDPEDWRRPGVDEIVRRVVAAADRGDGNVILLHDAGGERNQTVEAIPGIVEALRGRGFQFVTIAQLLGRSRDDVMPPVAAEERWQTWIDRLGFGAINATAVTVHWLFLLGIVLGIARLLIIGTLALYQHWRSRRATFDTAYAPTVAVVVPAYNEEKVIVQTIASLLASEHPKDFEIIVVDDGSTDATYRRACDAFPGDPRVRVYTKPNGGKPAALNFGVSLTQAEIVVVLDADTLFTRDTLTKLIRHFADPRVGAVAGNAKVGNRINVLTRWQALEYVTSQNLDRRAFDVLNCITVVPGAVGAWRRLLVEQAGGFSALTLAEDADLTMAIRKRGYAIVYEEEAVALTEAPDTVRGFIRQRYRWMYGTMQAAWKHADALLRPRYGALGFVALPNVFIFQVLFPLVSPVMDLLLFASLAVAGFNHWQHPAEYSDDAVRGVVFYYAIFMVVDFLAAALAFALEPKEDKWLLVGLFWQRFCYRQLMYYVAVKSSLASLRGVQVGWGKQERKATVKA